MKIKKQKAQKCVSLNTKLNVKIMKTVQKQLKQSEKKNIQKRNKFDVYNLNKDQKEFVKGKLKL